MTYMKDIVFEKEIQFADFVSNAKHFLLFLSSTWHRSFFKSNWLNFCSKFETNRNNESYGTLREGSFTLFK